MFRVLFSHKREPESAQKILVKREKRENLPLVSQRSPATVAKRVLAMTVRLRWLKSLKKLLKKISVCHFNKFH